jgi:hypothetical protein
MEAPFVYPPDDEVIRSAAAAIEEIREHIDHQSKDAESIDTKGAAILTATIGTATFVASRVGVLDSDLKRLSGLVAILVVTTLIACLFQALRPRGPFSYGAEPRRLVEILDRHSHKTTMLWLADSLVESRELNVTFLEVKQEWYQRSLRTMAAAGLSVAWMIQTGAIT